MRAALTPQVQNNWEAFLSTEPQELFYLISQRFGLLCSPDWNSHVSLISVNSSRAERASTALESCRALPTTKYWLINL